APDGGERAAGGGGSRLGSRGRSGGRRSSGSRGRGGWSRGSRWRSRGLRSSRGGGRRCGGRGGRRGAGREKRGRSAQQAQPQEVTPREHVHYSFTEGGMLKPHYRGVKTVRPGATRE